MKRLEFPTYCDFTNKIEDVVYKLQEKNNKGIDIDIVAKYEEARKLIKELIVCCDYEINGLKIEEEKHDGYSDEYIVSISNVCGPLQIFCEPYKRNGKYIALDSKVAFVLDNCSSACLKNIDSEMVFEVGIGDDDDDTLEFQDSSYAYISKDKDGNPSGFNKCWTTCENGATSTCSFSYYTTNKYDLQNTAREFGITL